MRRFFYFLLFLSALLFFHEDFIGLAIKSLVRVLGKGRLAYRDLCIKNGRLLLQDAVLFDVSGQKSALFLRSEAIWIRWNDLFSFSLRFEKPSLTLSADLLKSSLFSSAKGLFSFKVQIEDGILDWTDSTLPMAKFSYLPGALDVSWKQGVMKARKIKNGWRISSEDLPLSFLSQHIPIFDSVGLLCATIDVNVDEEGLYALSVQGQGKNLAFQLGDFYLGGSVAIDWETKHCKVLHWPSLIFGTERLRLSFKGGEAKSINSELRKAEVLATFQAGLGAKWEGKAEALSGCTTVPVAWEGRAFLALNDCMWAEGNCHFGNAVGRLAWQENRWRFEWEGLEPAEGTVLQGFASVFNKRVSGWKWKSGSVKGAFVFEENQGVRWERFEGIDICLLGPSFEAGCGRATLQEGKWNVESSWLKSGSFIDCKGHASLDCESRKAFFEGIVGEDRAIASVSFDDSFNYADIIGTVGDLRFCGSASVMDKKKFELAIPRFEGKIPSWLLKEEIPFSIQSGRIFSIGSGFQAKGSWSDTIRLDSWSVGCKAKQVALVYDTVKIVDLQAECYADKEGFDLVASQGILALSVGNTTIEAPISSPRIHWTGCKMAYFDVRLQGKQWDLLRVVGTQENGTIQIDSNRSHFFGSPLIFHEFVWDKGLDLSARFGALVSWRLLESFLEKKQFDLSFARGFEGDLQFEASLNHHQNGWRIDVATRCANGQLRGIAIPFSCRFQGTGDTCFFSTFEIEPFFASCHLIQDNGVWRLHEGKAGSTQMGISFDFEGKVSEGPRIDITLNDLKADLALVTKQLIANDFPLEGILEGHGCITIDQRKIESDFDLMANDLLFKNFSVQNKNPLHLYASSDQIGYLTGIDCRIVSNNLEAHANVDLIQADFKQRQIAIQEARVHIPSDWVSSHISEVDRGGEIGVFGEGKFFFDGSEWSCNLQESFFPIFGSLQHIKDLSVFINPHMWKGSALLSHHGKWASIWGVAEPGSMLQGNIKLQEEDLKDCPPLTIDWSYVENMGVSIDSIEGSFGGIDASFRLVDDEDDCLLVGSAGINFQRLSQWIPPAVSEVFHELEMGAGYELKGNLCIPKLDLANLTFEGLFSGKELELFGYQFRSLMAEASLSQNMIRITDLKISDSAGILNIDEIQLQSNRANPWTIDMPKLTIQDMRPSLFRKPNEGVKTLTPLLVRHLTMTDFCGFLEDGKTYRANGNLFFVNSFKREKTMLDIPSHLFGRIIGLDLELLIPVEGDLSFTLKDGYFHLNELKNAFSEGRRSEFFLVQSDTSPRMDLKGNLEILVTMKQFVLFALTEAFMISIDGKLSDPQFSLQKKRSFL